MATHARRGARPLSTGFSRWRKNPRRHHGHQRHSGFKPHLLGAPQHERPPRPPGAVDREDRLLFHVKRRESFMCIHRAARAMSWTQSLLSHHGSASNAVRTCLTKRAVSRGASASQGGTAPPPTPAPRATASPCAATRATTQTTRRRRSGAALDVSRETSNTFPCAHSEPDQLDAEGPARQGSVRCRHTAFSKPP